MPSRKKDKLASESTAPDGAGQVPLANPGEYPVDGAARGIRRNTLGAFPARGHRAGGGTTIGPAERVALQRNLEFSDGGRSALGQANPLNPAAADTPPPGDALPSAPEL